jgi:hypothetical protein
VVVEGVLILVVLLAQEVLAAVEMEPTQEAPGLMEPQTREAVVVAVEIRLVPEQVQAATAAPVS